MKTVALTGATSMTGIALIKQCVANGINVIAFIRPHSKNIQRLPSNKLVLIVENSLEDIENLDISKYCSKIDVFYHIGWMNNSKQERDSCSSQMENIPYAINSVYLAKQLGCYRYIYLGGQSEIGLTDKPINEKSFINPVTINGLFKYTAGKLTCLECQKIGLEHIWVRLVSEYGTNDHEDRLIKQFIKNCKANIPMDLSDCTHKWDYVYEDDVGEALLLAGLKGHAGKIYTLGSGECKPLKEYLELAKDVVNPMYSPGYGKVPYNENSIQYLCADISELERDTGWKPTISFEEGIKRMIKEYL